MHIIMSSSFGDGAAYTATLANAMAILGYSADRVPAEIKDFSAQTAGKKIVTKEYIISTLTNILNKAVGEKASKLITVTEELKQEVVQFCFKNKVKLEPSRTGTYSIDSYIFFKDCNWLDISCFASQWEAKDVVLMDEWQANSGAAYAAVAEGKFKEGMTELAKIRKVLSLSNEFSHRDCKYELIEVREEA